MMLDRYEITDDWCGIYFAELTERVSITGLIVLVFVSLVFWYYQTPGSKRHGTRDE